MNLPTQPHDRHFELDETDLLSAVAAFVRMRGRDIAPGKLRLALRDGTPCTGVRLDVIDGRTPLFDGGLSASDPRSTAGRDGQA